MVLPLSVTRWIGFVQEAKNNNNSIPPTATFASISLFALSGFFNVVLLLYTKPNSGLFGNLVLSAPRRPPERQSTRLAVPDIYQSSIQTSERKEASSSEGLGMLPS